MLREARIAVLSVLLLGHAASAQDFLFGVHGGDTRTRLVSHTGASGFQHGGTRGLSGTLTVKPWLALSLELLVVDKGQLPSQSKAHSYFEVPYMVRIGLPWQFAGVRPFGVLGAAYAYELTCDTGCASPSRVTNDFSFITAWGATYTRGRWEVAVERRRTRGQNSVNRNDLYYSTNDMRSLLLRLSFIIPGVAPDWM